MAEYKKTKRAPIFGVISLVLPFIGIPLAYLVTKPTEAGWGWGGLTQVVGIILFTISCGVISAIISLARDEKYVAIAFGGLFFNIPSDNPSDDEKIVLNNFSKRTTTESPQAVANASEDPPRKLFFNRVDG